MEGMRYSDKELKIIEREQAKLKKFKISYYYLATGMEGAPDIYPEKIIEAPTKELAIYLYHLMFFDGYYEKSFNEYMKQNEVYREWGTKVEELLP